MHKLTVIIIALVMALFVAGCEEGKTNATDRESKARDDSYEGIQQRQPAGGMDYSPTRELINYWMSTWEEEGKLSYVYLLASNGQEIGYFVFEGLPVSYCASLTPTYDIHDGDYDRGGDVMVPAPSMDGVYYSGNQCLQYFGKDALTGSYIEFSIGNGLNFFVTEQPLPKPEVEPLTTTTIEKVKEQR